MREGLEAALLKDPTPHYIALHLCLGTKERTLRLFGLFRQPTPHYTETHTALYRTVLVYLCSVVCSVVWCGGVVHAVYAL